MRNYPDVTILYNHGITHWVVVDNNLALFRSLCWMLDRSLVWFWLLLVSVIRLFIGPVMKTMLALVLRSLHVFIGLKLSEQLKHISPNLQCLEYQMLQGATWFTSHLRQPTAATPLGWTSTHHHFTVFCYFDQNTTQIIILLHQRALSSTNTTIIMIITKCPPGGNIHQWKSLGPLRGPRQPPGLPQWGQFGNHHHYINFFVGNPTMLS